VSNTPIDPITELAAGAAATHELFTAYVEAGFSRTEALQLTVSILTAGIGGSAQ
jgi:hypothetical protein